MITLKLTQGKETRLDDDVDMGYINGFKWAAIQNNGKWYAVTNVPHPTGKRLWVSWQLHRLIMGLGYGDPQRVDHIDGDGLNNQRSNLRLADAQQNRWNSKPVGGTSKYKGVNWHQFKNGTGKWRAQAKVDGKQHHLGLFTDEVEAAKVVDAFYVKAFGEFAYLNFPLEVSA
jgi:hypothetical protein